MHQKLTYKILLKHLVFSLFISIFAVNAIGSYLWLVNRDSIAIELSDLKDSEPQKEETKLEKDAKDKISVFAGKIEFVAVQQISKATFLLSYYSFPNLDVSTPPPKSSLSFL